ncbi:CrcB family protein [Paenalkalicoccus suaedae]|uniref:Fluoride-specific ion channel FluC n=1 Tax=Paenalkalicoccus suaedae TaxID=2592382 RepID=A0A859FAK0_9BACI|nr:CrcB family protein [Paenalkalicoccus suaedae]QKS69967.1 CrcB family protein [Paenalkalicoccus suaedae]
MRIIIAVALGGALGSVLRYAVLVALGPVDIALATLTVNVVGSLLLGYLTGMWMSREPSPWLRAGLGTGLCGGFTTMSTFALDTIALVETNVTLAAAYIGGTFILSIGSCFIGLALGLWQSGKGESK